MEQFLSKYKTAFYVLLTISCLILIPFFATHEMVQFNDIPIKYIILSFLLFITLMIFLFFNGLSNKSFWISQIYFLLSIISLFLILVLDFEYTLFILLRIFLILSIVFSIYPFMPFIILIKNGLQYMDIKNEFIVFLIWVILFDAFFTTSVLLGNLYRKKNNK